MRSSTVHIVRDSYIVVGDYEVSIYLDSALTTPLTNQLSIAASPVYLVIDRGETCRVCNIGLLPVIASFKFYKDRAFTLPSGNLNSIPAGMGWTENFDFSGIIIIPAAVLAGVNEIQMVIKEY